MIRLFNEDCVSAMKKMNDDSYELAIVDPPYGIGIAKRFADNGQNNCKNWGSYDMKTWDSCVPDQEYFDQLFRVSRNQIVFGGNYFTDKIARPSQGWIVWNKCQRNFTLSDAELAWTSFDRATRVFDFSRPAAKHSNEKTGGMFHPTKKPVELYMWILNRYAKDGDRILDTHLGSGAIAIAAADHGGVSLDGYEIDIDYYTQAHKRLTAHQNQFRLF